MTDLKFSFSEKATKIWSYHPLYLTFTKLNFTKFENLRDKQKSKVFTSISAKVWGKIALTNKIMIDSVRIEIFTKISV